MIAGLARDVLGGVSAELSRELTAAGAGSSSRSLLPLAGAGRGRPQVERAVRASPAHAHAGWGLCPVWEALGALRGRQTARPWNSASSLTAFLSLRVHTSAACAGPGPGGSLHPDLALPLFELQSFCRGDRAWSHSTPLQTHAKRLQGSDAALGAFRGLPACLVPCGSPSPQPPAPRRPLGVSETAGGTFVCLLPAAEPRHALLAEASCLPGPSPGSVRHRWPPC